MTHPANEAQDALEKWLKHTKRAGMPDHVFKEAASALAGPISGAISDLLAKAYEAGCRDGHALAHSMAKASLADLKNDRAKVPADASAVTLARLEGAVEAAERIAGVVDPEEYYR